MKRFLPATFAFLLLTPAAAIADTTTVDPAASGSCARNAVCKTITEAIGVSQAGDTVKVKPGAYPENVVIDVADLTLDAELGAVITGGASGSPLTLGAAGGKVLDVIVFKAGTDPAVSVTGTGENRIGRSTVIGAGDGIVLSSSLNGSRALAVDSTLVSAQGTAFRATTSLLATASMQLNHVTTAKGPKAVSLEGGGGNLAFVSKSSILHGTGASTSADTNLSPLNTVTATFEKSDASPMTGPAAFDGNATPDDQLFGEGLLLKQGAPVIDKGGPVEAGESATDVQGDARTIGGATDIGADEYINHAPVVKLTLPGTAFKTGEVVAPITTAADIDGKSDLATYAVDWGDGLVDTALGVTHSYSKAGSYTIKFTATDKAGAVSEPATAQVTVTDGSPPQVQITSPKAGTSIKLAGRLKKSLAVKGVHADNDAVARVEIAITRRAGGCAQYDGKAFVAAKCKQFKFVPATLSGFRFRLDTVKLKFTKGAYEVRARATDSGGNRSTGFAKDAKTLVKFKIS